MRNLKKKKKNKEKNENVDAAIYDKAKIAAPGYELFYYKGYTQALLDHKIKTN